MEAKSKYSPNIKPYLRTHEIIDSVDGFSHIALNYNGIPPIKIKTKPMIFIMKRKPNAQFESARVKALMEDDSRQLTSGEFLEDDVVDGGNEESLEEVTFSEAQPVPTSSEFSGVSKEENHGFIFENPIEVDEEAIRFDEKSLVESERKIIEEGIKNEEPSVVDDVGENKIKVEKKIKKKKIDQEKIELTGEFPREGSGVKEAVRKMIQIKKKENRAKQEVPVEIKENVMPEIEINGRKKNKIVKKDSGEIEPTINEIKVTNVKESIRNIINQFKEFEKDLASDDPESMKKWSSDDSVDSVENTEQIGAVSLEDNINEMDKFIVENNDPIVLNEAKKSLKEIVQQIRELQSELSIEADDRFDEIADKFAERPISETLLNFSEALKDLMKRRKTKAINNKKTIEINNSNKDTELTAARKNIAKKKNKIITNGDIAGSST